MKSISFSSTVGGERLDHLDQVLSSLRVIAPPDGNSVLIIGCDVAVAEIKALIGT